METLRPPPFIILSRHDSVFCRFLLPSNFEPNSGGGRSDQLGGILPPIFLPPSFSLIRLGGNPGGKRNKMAKNGGKKMNPRGARVGNNSRTES